MNFFNYTKQVLIIGETGTGKSQLAKEIHQSSKWSNHPFLIFNAATISESLFENELFGHLKGSFTGANHHQNGYLKMVGSGTLFIDEIGELSLGCQKKLLMVLEEKIFFPIGSSHPEKFMGNIILATHQDLHESVLQKKFRSDLFFRINKNCLKLEPLRSNTVNLKLLFDKFFQEISQCMSIDASWAQETIWIKVKNYQWPGNIRELKNAVEWILFHLKEGVITYPSYLSESSFDKNLGHVNLPDLSPLGYKEALECFEKDYIMKQVKKYRGKITSICHEKGFNKVTLLSKMRKYNINRLQFINDF